jgi:LysM repeat protein
MRRVLPLFITFLFLLPGLLRSQTAPKEPLTPLLTSRDSLFLTVVEGKKFLQHPVKSKQTLFSLARYYGLSLEELYENNTQFRTDPTLRTGTRVKIPIPNRALKRYKNTRFVASKNVPVYYVVQPGDNLYQICKRNFGMPVDSILKRNKLKDNNIRPGQLLHVAWMGVDGIPAEWRPVRTFTKNDAMKERFDEEKKHKKEGISQGVCFWQKDSKEKGDLYAMHREAVIGSTMAITNPMGGRTVYAKVIGRIPSGYESNIEVILSPEAARTLGARDPRFFVKVKFLK